MAKKILLADDSPTIRKVVELTFAEEGIEVYSVPDGDAAMVTFVRVEPDMVIADVNMPGMNGYRLCEMIKEDETTRHIPVILLVGSFEAFDPGEAARVGCDHYFTKPFRSIRELVDKVHECFADGYDQSQAGHDTADIEDLYKSSLEPAAAEPRPEDEVPAFASDENAEDETHFDNGESLDKFLSESRAGQVPPVESRPDNEPGTASAGADQWSDDELLDNLGPAEKPAFERADIVEHAPPVMDDASDDDVLGLGGGFRRPSPSEVDVFLDVGSSATPAAEPAGSHEDEQATSDEGEAAAADEVEHVAANEIEHAPAEEHEFDAPADNGADLHMTAVPSEPARTTGDLGRSPWEQPAAEMPAIEAAATEDDASAPEAVLGDVGMDDDIIETSHPSGEYADADRETPAFVQNATPIDPFTERVEVSDTSASDQLDEPSAAETQHIEVAETPEQPPSAQTAEPQAPPLAPHVTPELIESIVASVLEKMSDRAVRQAAQEAVPRIAEKLIREALTDDERKAKADAASE